jgi:threonine dehydrogenase-like Zn-dependent dehydrogenase
LMLAKALGANQLIGTDVSPERLALAQQLGLVDYAIPAGPETLSQILDVTQGRGCEKAIDCSASEQGRLTAIQGTRKWGDIAFVGEGGACCFHPSPDIIHDQKRIHGSWVTSIWRMEELVERLVRWNIHPADLVTDRFGLEEVAKAYELMAGGRCGKVAVVFDEGVR